MARNRSLLKGDGMLRRSPVGSILPKVTVKSQAKSSYFALLTLTDLLRGEEPKMLLQFVAPTSSAPIHPPPQFLTRFRRTNL
jgi:hypothetical protein